MNYEIKPFSVFSYDADVDAGWEPTLRNWAEYAHRGVLVAILPECADPRYRVCSIYPATGEVHQHDARGMFDPNQGETCLDLVMRRGIIVKREVRGVAVVSDAGHVVCVWPGQDSVCGVETVSCIITIEGGLNHD